MTRKGRKRNIKKVEKEVEGLKLQPSSFFPCQLSCLSHFAQSVACIKSKLSRNQLDLFRTTRVGRLIDTDIVFNGQLIHQVLLREATSSSENDIKFIVAGKLITFGKSEFEAITGLEERRSVQSTGSLGIRRRFFNDQVTVHLGDLVRTFLNMESENDEDIVKVALLYFVEFALLGKEIKVKMDPIFFKYIDDLNVFDSVDWGSILYKRTLDGLKRCNLVDKAAKWKSNKKKAKYSIYGFPFAFQVWLYEVIPGCRGFFTIKISRNRVPYILNWHCKQSPSAEELERHIFGVNNAEPNEFNILSLPMRDDEIENTNGKDGGKEDRPILSDPDDVQKTADKALQNDDIRSASENVTSQRSEERMSVIEADIRLMKTDIQSMQSDMQKVLHSLQTIEELLISFKDRDVLSTSTRHESFHSYDYIVDDADKDEEMKIDEKEPENVVNEADKPSEKEADKVDMKNNKKEKNKQIEKEGRDKKKRVYAGKKKTKYKPDDSAVVLIDTLPVKRIRKESSLLRSPFINPVKRPKLVKEYDPLIELPSETVTSFRNWMASGERDMALTVGGEFDRDFFATLMGTDKWLRDEHMDACFLLIRYKCTIQPEITSRKFTTANTCFIQHLEGRRDEVIKLRDQHRTWDWRNDSSLMDYVFGQLPDYNQKWHEVDEVYIPYNIEEKHWVLMRIDLLNGNLSIWDSLPSMYSLDKLAKILEPLRTLLPELLHGTNYYGKRLDACKVEGLWPFTRDETVPLQTNGGDCGVFTIKYLEYILTNTPMNTLEPSRMRFFREQLAMQLWANTNILI